MDKKARFFMICFDIRDERRLVKVSDTLENYGCRVQRSVFECFLDEVQLSKLKAKMERLIDPGEDQVRYYVICPRDVKKILIDGPGTVTIDPDFLVI